MNKLPHSHLITPRGNEWIRQTLTPSNTCIFGMRVLVSRANGISIGLAVFEGLTRLPNTHTDHAT